MSPVLVPVPVSPTFMPHFLNRSPSSSSFNTRQRSDYEASQLEPLPPPALDDGNASAAVEMPFASEPALEGELEAELPPLKKLKSDDGAPLGGAVSSVTVKGILCRKSSSWHGGEDEAMRPAGGAAGGGERIGALTPLSLSTLSKATPAEGHPSSSSLAPSSLGGSFSPVCSTAASSRPMSRRSSSGASSCGSGVFKAVRFASGNGFSPFDDDSPYEASPGAAADEDGSTPREREELSGPVAAVVHLTHSREAYDRSPIVVEDGLKLPPRERKVGAEHWIRCGTKKRAKEAGAMVKDRVLLGEAAALKGQREKLRLEIEALGRSGGDGLGIKGSMTGASPLLRHMELDEATIADALGVHGSPASPTCVAPAMVREYSSSTRPEEYEDPNTASPDLPADVDADVVEAMSEVGDDNPGDALSDDGSVGSDAGDVAEAVESRRPDDDDDEVDGSRAGEDDDDAAGDEDQDEAVAEEEEEEDPEDVAERRRTRQMGMCGLGKWSRGDVFSACDALGGF